VIPVRRREPPAGFDAQVRVPGIRCLYEKVGQAVPPGFARTSGKPCARVFRNGTPLTQIDELHGEDLADHWSAALPMLTAVYGPTCMYSCFRLRLGVDDGSVDHFIPKSTAPARAYDWDNLRLSLPRFNRAKGARVDLLDPFALRAGTFALDLVFGKVEVGPGCDPTTHPAALATIAALQLNARGTCVRRVELVAAYQEGAIPLDHLRRENPFVAAEIERQGLPVQGVGSTAPAKTELPPPS